MKSLLLSSSLLLGLIGTTFAAIGDVCRSSSGSGTCKSTGGGSCNGFFVTGACPLDPDNIKCCISASCTSSSGTVGQCLDNSVLPCSGGAFQAGLCPGPDNVQCCLPTAQAPPPAPSPTPQPQPPAPSCASFMVVPDDIIPFFDDIIFSREATKNLPGIASGAAAAGGVCAAIVGAFTDGIGALPCGLFSAGAGWLAYKAGECASKNQCLKLADALITECRGDSSCC